MKIPWTYPENSKKILPKFFVYLQNSGHILKIQKKKHSGQAMIISYDTLKNFWSAFKILGILP